MSRRFGSRVAAFNLCVALVAVCGGCGGRASDSESMRRGVVAGLVASGDPALGEGSVRIFPAQVDDPWAVAYDPASPPGCTPGGLWGAPEGPALPESPCAAWVLERRKTTWLVVARGTPGSFLVPERVPRQLGDPARLSYLQP